MRRSFVLLLWWLAVAGGLRAAPAVRFNVRDYGATGDGVRKDTAAIARTIAACVQAGGGEVEFPAGRYLTGTIRLESNVMLRIGPGATILGSPDVADYPIVPNPWGESDWQGPTQMSALVYADGAENIGITGPGTIDGQGLIWWKRLWFTEKKASAKRDVSGVDPAEAAYVEKHGGRPRMIRLVNCRHVRLADLTLRNSPRWTVHPLFCDYVTVTGLTIINPASAPNTDGINPESCRNVHIANCHIDTGDDGITLKSGRDAVGRKKARPTENVVITNCTFRRAHGAIVIGSEMSGDVRNVVATNCVMQGTEKGLRIKSNRDRGGVVERIRVSNLVMQNVVEAINIVTFYFSSDAPDRVFPVNDGTPRFRDIHISDLTARGSKRAGQITGLREMPIRDVSFHNVRISAKTGFTLQDAADIRFAGVQIDAQSGPALKAERVSGIEIDGWRSTAAPKDGALLDCKDVTGLWIRDARAPVDTSTFLTLRGAASRKVVLRQNDLREARIPVAAVDGASLEVVVREP
jgi:polygalacturonase